MEFGLSGYTWIMVDGYLFEPAVLLKHYQGWKKSVHPDKERNPFGIFSLYHFQRASCVCSGVSCHQSAKPIGNFRLNTFEVRILSVGPDACDKRKFICIGEENVEVERICLKVGVNISHPLRLSIIDSRFDGGAQSSVAIETKIKEMMTCLAFFFYEIFTVVGRSFIEKKNACRHSTLRYEFPECRCQSGNAFFFIVYRNDYCKVIM